jgi:hypothetical protein
VHSTPHVTTSAEVDDNRDLYGIEVTVNSMAPVLRKGCHVYLNPNLRPGTGDAVLVRLARSHGATWRLGELVSITKDTVRLQQYTPRRILRLARRNVERVDPVVWQVRA